MICSQGNRACGAKTIEISGGKPVLLAPPYELPVIFWVEIRGMKPPFAAALMVLGTICVILGLTLKQFYGVKGPNLKVTNKEVDNLAGRIVFCTVGGGAFLLGTLYFLLQ